MTALEKTLPPKSIFRIGLFDVFALVALYSLICLQMPKFADDPGVGWHLASGDWILGHKSIPMTDPFLSAPFLRPWVSDQWLSDVIFSLLFSAGSWQLVYALITVVFVLTFLVILYRGVSRITGSAFAPCVAVLIAFKTSQIHFILRPVVLAFFFFSILYVTIARFDQNSGQRDRSFLSLALAIAVLFVLWANCHPSFVLGIALLAALTIGLIVDRYLFGSSATSLTKIKQAIGLTVIAVCATFINPWGIALHQSILSLAQSDFFMNFHMEWRSPDFKNYEGVLFEFSILVLILASFVANKAWRWSGFYLVSVLLFAHLGLRSVRVLPFFSIVAAIPLAYSLESFGMSKIWKWHASLARLRKAFAFVECREKSCAGGVVILSIACTLLVTLTFFGRGIPFYPGGYGPSAQTYPYQAITFLSTQTQKSGPAVVAASPDLGGFITFFGAGKLKPVIDDRNTLLGEGFYKSFFDNIKLGGRWRDWLSCAEVSFLVLGNETSLTTYLKETAALPLANSDNLVSIFGVKSAPKPNDCPALVHWRDDKILD
jgi:hypothetical protein